MQHYKIREGTACVDADAHRQASIVALVYHALVSATGRRPFLTRVILTNYKSIAACDVRLQPLTFLVGPNGSGKSNFLDALRFVTDSLRRSLDHALRERGGIGDVRRRSGGHPNHFGMRLEFALPTGAEGHYAFRVAARQSGGFEVQTEQCFLNSPNAWFKVETGQVTSSSPVPPPALPDRLYW